jgi:hypothetical protein
MVACGAAEILAGLMAGKVTGGDVMPDRFGQPGQPPVAASGAL